MLTVSMILSFSKYKARFFFFYPKKISFKNKGIHVFGTSQSLSKYGKLSLLCFEQKYNLKKICQTQMTSINASLF